MDRAVSHPEPFTVPPKYTPHTTSLILLHGTSTNGEVFGSALLEPFLSPSSGKSVTLGDLIPHAKFVFPSGRERRTTVLGGRMSNAWFDVWDFSDRTKGEDTQREGLRESIEYLGLVVKEEIERLPEDGKVIIGGFSMGSAMSMFLLLSGELERLGVGDQVVGLVGLSGWLPFRRQIEETAQKGEAWWEQRRNVRDFIRTLVELREWDGERQGQRVSGEMEEDGKKIDEKKGLKVWLGHGIEDEKVLLEWGTQMRDVLKMVGYEVSWNEYEGLRHWHLPGELEELVGFVEDVVQK
ncbi:hypothetical protein ACMFMG_009531 [Clarireedia jacksonii]